MTTQQESGAADDARPQKTSETLSEFVARVLSQLSLVAWLPSGALVLSLTFVFQLNTVLGYKIRPKDVSDAIDKALTAMTRISIGGGLLLFAAVIVLTIITQAFAYGAILVLQGFWGTLPVVEGVAKYRCAHFRNKLTRLQDRRANLTEQLWRNARAEIERQQRAEAANSHGQKSDILKWTPNILSYCGAVLTHRTPEIELTKDERECALGIPWWMYAPPDLVRRRANLDVRLQDFPWPLRVMPTQLGNILANYTDKIRRDRGNVETFVLKLYDSLPVNMRLQHDEQRDRLNLYCSMVFIVALIVGASVAILAPEHLPYAISVIVLGAVVMWLMYRAALASARVYGKYLLTIHESFPLHGP